MMALMWHVSTVIRSWLRMYMPSNIVLDRLRTRRGLRWCLPAAFVFVLGYLFIASFLTRTLAGGAAGWLNILVVICIWDAMKFAALGLLSPFLLLKNVVACGRTSCEGPTAVLDVHCP